MGAALRGKCGSLWRNGIGVVHEIANALDEAAPGLGQIVPFADVIECGGEHHAHQGHGLEGGVNLGTHRTLALTALELGLQQGQQALLVTARGATAPPRRSGRKRRSRR